MTPSMFDTIFRLRQRSIIDFVVRYHLATNRVIGSQLLAEITPNAVAKVTARLCALDLLTRYMLIPPETYFRPGSRSIRILGLSARSTEPLGPQSLPTDYATLIYATLGNASRRRLTPREVDEYMPWLPGDLAQAPYCIDANGRLDLVRVDLGGSPQHVARKTTAAAHERLDIPQVSELAVASRFQVVVLTTSAEKARAIARALSDCGCTDAVRVHLAVIPRLSFLLL